MRSLATVTISSGPLRLRAYWIDRQTIALPPSDSQANWGYKLLYAADAEPLAKQWALSPAHGFTADQSSRFPQLKGYAVFRLPALTSLQTLKTALKGQIAVAAFDSSGQKYITGVQLAGVLDDLFYFDGKLGPQFPSDPSKDITITLWAPTARTVHLLLFANQTDDVPADNIAMIETNGVWSAEIKPSWRNRYYLFRVEVFVPSLQQTVTNLVTDPYSPDLALNGIKSRLTDLNHSASKPESWDQHRSPELHSPRELTIWELHVREFSANDPSVPTAQQGTYLAFTNPESNGMQHLKRLATAGLKAVHLLPTFHIASINEDKALWKSPGDLSKYPPDGSQQQAAVAAIKDFDPYNWGYDPVHYMAPEGGYASNPDNRVREYRAMVQALHASGLRVIQDVVFNHTSAHGQDRDSILDRIVPSYYYRLDADGNVLNNSCCSDTASERRMMEKLMVDCLVQNARQYKIDGFRFDLMSFHFVYNLRRIQQELARLTLDKDGVDGSKIYLYGEGWTTGATANSALGPNASQQNLYGTGVGTFNDRLRDAVRGGNPFGDLRVQGFATGVYTDPSEYTAQALSQADQLNQLLDESDWIRAGLAGNLRDFSFLGSRGSTITAGALDYAGQKVGYTSAPIECVNYCSVHDNQSLFDAIQLKSHTADDAAARAARQALALSFVALGQGIPFFFAGDELLRSKDMDNNSYNSGDWFNKLDFTYASNNWGVGLPLASENEKNWNIMQPLLANPALKPGREQIAKTRDAFEALLRIRASSDLFHMQTLAEVQQNLNFFKTDPGVIAMRLKASVGTYSGYQDLIIIFNATKSQVSLRDQTSIGTSYRPHPELQAAGIFHPNNGIATVPPLTTAVFVAS